MHAAGLALVIPSGQSLVADYYNAASRGSAFGALYLTSALGGMGGSIMATNLGDISSLYHHGTEPSAAFTIMGLNLPPCLQADTADSESHAEKACFVIQVR